MNLMLKELYHELHVAIIDRARKRRAVQRWMNEQGNQGHMRHNGEAPGWMAYEKAEAALSTRIRALENVKP